MTTLKSLTLAGAVLVTLALHANAAQATEYGAVTIRNPTSNTIHYQIKWGDGEWRRVCLEPYTNMHHWIELDEYDRHPCLHVRFDYIGGDGDYTEKCYHLNTYKTCYPRSGGKVYTFKYHGRYHIDLHAGY